MVTKKKKSDNELLQEISEKLDKVVAVLAIQDKNLNVDSKIVILKNAGLESKDIGPFVGLSGSAVRDRKGWKIK